MFNASIYNNVLLMYHIVFIIVFSLYIYVYTQKSAFQIVLDRIRML
jgi:hypothetical protein